MAFWLESREWGFGQERVSWQSYTVAAYNINWVAIQDGCSIS